MLGVKKIFVLFFLLTSVSGASWAQRLHHVQGDLLVRLGEGVKERQLLALMSTFNGKPTQIKLSHLVSAPLNIWLYRFDHTTIHERDFVTAVRRLPGVAEAQLNHLVSMRSTVPDDAQFNSQWQYINTGQGGGLIGADIDIDLAWDVTTGGVTINGDTIVVCALDDGVSLTHDDFGDNLWINHAEIPGNGIDDDGNGYVDDYRGWNSNANNDNIAGGGHGTPVAGIMGAKGNNGRGVAGMSWDVKVMIVKNDFNTNEAAVLSAYTYPLVQRMRYNASNGAEGAFVVSTNASWGVDFGQPSESPLWCAFYDTLGVHGIISCGATINGNNNVDLQGDLPTACPSDYLISVTNMNRNDVKVTQAGYGLETIDLGAFGEGTWTTSNPNGYAGFGGTSGATPHVAGAIGLLYAAPCPRFAALTKADPAAAALLMKQYILAGTDPNESLQGITVTGGRLNVNNSMQLLMSECSGCLPATSVTIASEPFAAAVNWTIADSIERVDLRWRAAGSELWQELDDVSAPLALEDLAVCTNYELQLRTYCPSDTTAFSTSRFFRTQGCCSTPTGLQVTGLTVQGGTISWAGLEEEASYRILVQAVGAPDVLEIVTSNTSFALDSLEECTNYEVRIGAACTFLDAELSAPLTFTTRGCGACRDTPYCLSPALNGSEEWLERFVIGDFVNVSGPNDGYGNFTGAPEELILEQGGTYPLVLEPGFAGNSFQEGYAIWIDFNKDGVFSFNERVFRTPTTSASIVTSTLYIPAGAELGDTRLRVVMQFQGVNTACPAPLGSDIYGEIEDYCISIRATSNCAPTQLIASSVDTASVLLNWDFVGPAIQYDLRYRAEGTSIWTELSTMGLDLALSGLSPCTNYQVQVKVACSEAESEYSELAVFTTECILSTTDALPKGISAWQLSPNPFTDRVQVSLTLDERQRGLHLECLNLLGQPMAVYPIASELPGQQSFSISLGHLPPGVYLLRLRSDEGMQVLRKLVKH